MNRRVSGVLCTATVLAIALTGCGSGSSSDGTVEDAKAQASAVDEKSDAAKLDACTMLTGKEVSSLIKVTVEGRPDSGVGESSCVWENPDTYYSVTVRIGAAGTAANGTVPPDEPGFESEEGPDGIRFDAAGSSFVGGGDRLCGLQVATNRKIAKEHVDEVRLIKLVRGRM